MFFVDMNDQIVPLLHHWCVEALRPGNLSIAYSGHDQDQATITVGTLCLDPMVSAITVKRNGRLLQDIALTHQTQRIEASDDDAN